MFGRYRLPLLYDQHCSAIMYPASENRQKKTTDKGVSAESKIKCAVLFGENRDRLKIIGENILRSM